MSKVIDAFHGVSGRGVLDHGGAYQGPCERHEERGGNALIRHICDEESQSVVWQVEYVVEIAAHLAGSLPARGQFPIWKLRQRLGDEGLLDLPRQLHFRFEAFAYDHLFLEQVNKIDKIKYIVVAYENSKPMGCGAIKEYAPNTMEIKRMYTSPESRGKGIATKVLAELERWATELSYEKCILETGKKQPEAIGLYKKNGYKLYSKLRAVC